MEHIKKYIIIILYPFFNVEKKEIPIEWMAECLKPGEKAQDPKRFFI